jgi:hypothetical protein
MSVGRPDPQGCENTAALANARHPYKASANRSSFHALGGRPERASDQTRRRRLLPREAAARRWTCLIRAHRSVAWIGAVPPADGRLLLSGERRSPEILALTRLQSDPLRA